eukprot:Awhi_evm1s1742
MLYHKIHMEEGVESKEGPQKEFRMKDYLKDLSYTNRLKFKLRSGTCGLNVEKGSQRGNPEERMCECCDENEEEDVVHFLLRCSRFAGIREVLLYSVEDNLEFVERWRASSELEKCIILLKNYIIEDESGEGDVVEDTVGSGNMDGGVVESSDTVAVVGSNDDAVVVEGGDVVVKSGGGDVVVKSGGVVESKVVELTDSHIQKKPS